MLITLAKDPMKLFDDILTGSKLPAAPDFRVDISEDETAFHIEAELPGVTKEQIGLHIENDVLTIKAERRQPEKESKKDYHQIERSYGIFSRRFNLGEIIDQDTINADFEGGMLHISLPKARPARKTREISIN